MFHEDSARQTDQTQAPSSRVYLGDGVFVAFDGSALTLTTEDGLRTTNTIVLEFDVFNELLLFVERLKLHAEGR